MKTKFLIIIALLMGLVTQAQPPHEQGSDGPHGSKEKREKIEAMKREYITTKLSLTTEEAQNFWPVYNEFMEKIHALEKRKRKAMKGVKDQQTLTDDQVNGAIEQVFDSEQSILNLKREYDKKFKEVLSVQKVGKLYMAEQSFRHELLRKMKEQGRPPQ